MPTITRLVQGKKNPNRVNLYLDDVFSFALSIDEVARHNLKKGLVLSIDQIDTLKQADEFEYIYAKILNFLSYRPRTIKEVRDRLVKYEIKDSNRQDSLINRLINSGYLSDLSFAKWFINSRNNNRPRSVRMLTAELRAKGVSSEVISSVINNVSSEEDSIRQLLLKKLKNAHELDDLARQKIYAYLSRQGYAWDKIKEVVKQWESE